MGEISCSRLATWRRCPFQYWCGVEADLKEMVRPHPYLTLGNIVHIALRAFYTLPPAERDLRALLACYSRAWREEGREESFSSQEERQRYYQQGYRLLREYGKRARPQEVRQRWLETKFSLDLGGHRLTGKVDRVDELEGGGLRVVDYKTGRPWLPSGPPGPPQPSLGRPLDQPVPYPQGYGQPAPSTREREEDLTARAYALMVMRSLDPPPRRAVVVYDYLQEGERVICELTPPEASRVERELSALLAAWGEDHFYFPLANEFCRACDFRPLCPQAPLEELLGYAPWPDPVARLTELAERHALPGLWARLAQVLLFRGEHEAAARAASGALSVFPAYPLAREQLATALARLGRAKEAADHLRSLWRNHPPAVAQPLPSGQEQRSTATAPLSPWRKQGEASLGLALAEVLLSTEEAEDAREAEQVLLQLERERDALSPYLADRLDRLQARAALVLGSPFSLPGQRAPAPSPPQDEGRPSR